MAIMNLMLGKHRGGLEQAALDYAQALQLAGYETLTVTDPAAWVNAPLARHALPAAHLSNLGGWDPLAAGRLRNLARNQGATAVICHGNRALSIALRALSGIVPIIGVAHNYKTRRFLRADYVFAITQHAASTLAQAIDPHRITLMPNMVRLPAPGPHEAYRRPPVIGSMGRFVKKKGFDVYLEALAILKSRGATFRAVLGGDGEERSTLRELVARHQLENHVAFTGWVENKESFFRNLDIFVLPSHHEPFGIVLLEAFAHQVPTVSTDAEGPREIIHPGQDALLVPRGDATALADALEQLLQSESYARKLAGNARALVEKDYTCEAMAARLRIALEGILQSTGSTHRLPA